MTITIPKENVKKWQGIFPGKSAGHFWTSFNMDLERMVGQICLSGRSQVVKSSDTSFTFAVPQKFVRTNADKTDRYWVLSSTALGRSANSSPVSAWTSDTITGSPTVGMEDMIVHGDSDIADTDASDRLLVSYNKSDGGRIALLNKLGSLYAWDTDWWEDTAGGGLSQSLMINTSHPMDKMQTLVAIGDGNRVHTIDKNDVVSFNRLSFPAGFTCYLIYHSVNMFWFGLKPDRGVDGKIAYWDGTSESYNEIPIEGIPLSGWVKDGIPYFINHYGQILRYNGQGFSEVQRFPMMEENLTFETTAAVGYNFISRYGCVPDGDIVKILINFTETSIRMSSGIWIFDTTNYNLYHYKSIGGYDGSTDYDFGQRVSGLCGGIIKVRGDATTDLLAGVNFYTDYPATTKNAIIKFNTNKSSGNPTNRGYFITPYLSSNEIESFWKNCWIKFKKFIHGDNKIVLKHRVGEPLLTSDNYPSYAQITWVSTTSFKCTLPTGVKTGYEVEVVAGRNSGCLSHISSYTTDTDGVSTVLIDETMPYSDTSLALAIFDNWNKSEKISDTSISNYNFSLLGSDSDGNQLNNGENCQIKVELRGKDQEIEQLKLISVPAVPAE